MIKKPLKLFCSVLLVVGMSNSTVRAFFPEKNDNSLPVLGDSDTNLTALNGRFSTLYEPSGIAPLSDGRFLVIEDEPRRALRLISFEATNETVVLSDESDLNPPAGLIGAWTLGVLDDLEGVAHDRSQRFYIVSSHDDSKPHWRSQRQKLLSFSIHAEQMSDVLEVLTLRRDLLATYPPLEAFEKGKRRKNDIGLNIEALAFDRQRDVLLIGLRAPILNDQAMVVRLLNPAAYLSGKASAEFAEQLWLLDLDKGGVRSMMYDDSSDQLLLISRRESHKDDSYKLWRLPADGTGFAIKINLDKHYTKQLGNVEGLTASALNSSLGSGVLFVRDNGNEKKDRGGDWFFLTRKQLGLDS